MRCRSPQPSAAISLAAVATCVRQPLSEILQSAAAGRWRRARPRRLHARLLSCASLQRRLVVVLARRQLPVVVRWYVLVARLVVVHPLRPAPQRIFKSPLATYPAPRRSRAACRRLLMRPPPAPCCAACRPCCRAARLPAAAAALHPRPAAAPPPIAIIAVDIQKFSERKNRARSNCRALDCYCMGVVSIQSKRATWTRFSLQP